MDFTKIATDTPNSYKKFADWLIYKYNTDPKNLNFHYLVGIIMEFFSGNNIFPYLVRTPSGWKIQLNGLDANKFRYMDLYDGWKMAFAIAFDTMELRFREGKIDERLTTRDLHAALLPYLPTQHQIKFNTFNAAVTNLRRGTYKNIIILDGIDYVKEGEEYYYSQSGIEKIKQYFIKLKIKKG